MKSVERRCIALGNVNIFLFYNEKSPSVRWLVLNQVLNEVNKNADIQQLEISSTICQSVALELSEEVAAELICIRRFPVCFYVHKFYEFNNGNSQVMPRYTDDE